MQKIIRVIKLIIFVIIFVPLIIFARNCIGNNNHINRKYPYKKTKIEIIDTGEKTKIGIPKQTCFK
jgi:hypothetical protein